MLNNKGFAVSSVLYTLLIAFLLFLGAALAQFSASSSLIGKANDDLVNGTSFEAMQVKPSGACENGNKWYQYRDGKTDVKISNTIVRIKSKYGTMYWPKDFKGSNFGFNNDGNVSAITSISNNGKVTAEVNNDTSREAKLRLKIYYSDNNVFAKYSDGSSNADGLGIYDLCD